MQVCYITHAHMHIKLASASIQLTFPHEQTHKITAHDTHMRTFLHTSNLHLPSSAQSANIQIHTHKFIQVHAHTWNRHVHECTHMNFYCPVLPLES